jgi:hypothetical protein
MLFAALLCTVLPAAEDLSPVRVSKVFLKTSVLNNSEVQDMLIRVAGESAEHITVKIPYSASTDSASTAGKICTQHGLLEDHCKQLQFHLDGHIKHLRGEMEIHATPAHHVPSGDLYLDLLKRSVVNSIYGEYESDLKRDSGTLTNPRSAHTMVGSKMLDNLHYVAEHALLHNTPGDFIETGVWRGGCCIFLAGLLKTYGQSTRTVYVADSFEGLPAPNKEQYPNDEADLSYLVEDLAVSLEQVQENFRRYNLLDQERVHFIKGFFSDTIPTAPVHTIAVLRMDGDMVSTFQVNTAVHLYIFSNICLPLCTFGSYPPVRKHCGSTEAPVPQAKPRRMGNH